VDDVLTGSQPATVAADGAAPAPDQAVQAGPRVFTAPDSGRRAAARSGFGSGVLTGAVIALAGVAIGALAGRDALSLLAVAVAALVGALAGGLAGGVFGRRRR